MTERAALWLPGAGLVPVDQLEARRAIQDYASDLDLARDQMTGDWVVVMEGPEGPFPVLGLGKRLLGRDEIMEKLYKHDARRHQGKLARMILKRQDERQAALEKERQDETGETAEALEWGLRKQGAHPNPRIFVPGR